MKKISTLFIAIVAIVNLNFGATLTVTTNADGGLGSLRSQIAAAATGDLINFDVSLNGGTITLTSGHIAFAKNLTIVGPGYNLLTISGNNSSRMFDITGGNVIIRGLKLIDGSQTVSAPNDGGAIKHTGGGSLSLFNIYFQNNIAVNGNGSQGGAVYYGVNGGALIADSCFFINCQADLFGAALTCNSAPASMDINYCVFDGNSTALQGTIYTNAIINNVINTSIINNTLPQGAGINFSGSNSTNTLLNCTFSNNQSISPGWLIKFDVDGTLNIMNSTFSNNNEPIQIQTLFGASTVIMQNNIFDNPGVNYSSAGSVTEISNGGNISNDASMSFLASTNDMVSTNPMLDVLANNGGFTPTHALLVGSPAIDNGIASGAPLLDQLNSPRIGLIDAGSLEFIVPPPCIADQTVAATNITLCANNTGTTITTGGSEIGINYYLRDDANDTIVDGPMAGTGSGISLNTGNISSTITYNVYGFSIADSANCNTEMTTLVAVTVLPAIDVTTNATASNTITANESGATYRWLDCNNSMSVIAGETNQSFTTTTNGDYAAEITVGSCVDTSACVNITIIGVNENSFGSVVKLYPNPATGNVSLNFGKALNNGSVIIADITGKQVYSIDKLNSQVLNLDINHFSKGIYFVKIENNNQQKVIKLIKQ